MPFYVYGINHRIAPIEIRERVHFKETQIIEASDALLEKGCQELVILNTCNRSEIFYLTEEEQGSIFIEKYLEEFFGISSLQNYAIFKQDQEALEHLLKVACGMESLLIGEDQILGQVKDAWQNAMDMGASKKILNRFFREAVAVAKSIKARSHVSDVPTSLSYIGVKKIAEEVDLESTPALVIGMGKMGRLALEYLHEYGADITIANRTYANSLKVLEEYSEGKILEYEDLEENLDNFSVIVSATSSPHHTLYPEQFSHRTTQVYLLDLSLPRDIEPQVGALEGVHLWDIDALQDFSDQNIRLKAETLASYEPELIELAQELIKWFENSDFEEIMNHVNTRCHKIAQETLEYIFRKTDLNHSEKKKVSKIVESALKKVAREPVLYILNNVSESKNKHSALKLIEKAYEQ